MIVNIIIALMISSHVDMKYFTYMLSDTGTSQTNFLYIKMKFYKEIRSVALRIILYGIFECRHNYFAFFGGGAGGWGVGKCMPT